MKMILVQNLLEEEKHRCRVDRKQLMVVYSCRSAQYVACLVSTLPSSAFRVIITKISQKTLSNGIFSTNLVLKPIKCFNFFEAIIVSINLHRILKEETEEVRISKNFDIFTKILEFIVEGKQSF